MMKNSYGLGLLTVLFWSTSATAFKITLRYLDMLPLLFYSTATALVILGVYLLIRGKFRDLFCSDSGKKNMGFILPWERGIG